MFTNRPAIQNDQKNQDQTPQAMGVLNRELASDFTNIRDAIQKRLLAATKGETTLEDTSILKHMIETEFNTYLVEQNLLYNRNTRTQLLSWVVDDIAGFGPLEPLLRDGDITEIMVNGPENIYVERFGILEYTNVKFESDAHLRRIIDRIVSPIGRRVDESSPMVDARLPNGFRVNATLPPLSLDGPTLTIRKFSLSPITAQDLIANNSLTEQLVLFLKACVEAKINLVVSGGTGTGKTTILNVLSSFIPAEERIITIEDTAELRLDQKHIVRLEKRPPNIEGKGEITIRQLVINALRMRPNRIIVGECRSSEALDMLQAMNTGHDGSMTTIHANSPRDALRRIEVMVMMAGMELPLKAIREQIAASVDLIIHLDRLKDGTRKVVQVAEVQAMEGDAVVMQELFVFHQSSFKNKRVIGSLKSTGLRPRFMSKLAANNIELPANVFEK